ncbi:MAG: hypothetical protein WCK67_04825 [bacterium]
MVSSINNINSNTQNMPTANPISRQVAQTPANIAAPNQAPQGPTASVGAVQIFINNPTVSTGGANSNQQLPPPQAGNALAGQPIQDQFVSTAKTAPQVQQPVAPTAPVISPVVQPAPVQNNIAAQNLSPDKDKKTEEKKDETKTESKKTEAKEKKPVIPLTKEYIMTLENYIKNENPDIRLMGVKELLKRFKEDDTRKSNQALTNLLNYALQDENQKIRLYSLMVLDAGYAKGDDFTYELLTKMQKSDKVFNQDAMTASQILLKRAGDNNLEYDKASKKDKDVNDLREYKQLKDTKDFTEFKDYKNTRNSKEFKEYKDNKVAEQKAAEQKNQEKQEKEPEVGKRLNFLAG